MKFAICLFLLAALAHRSLSAPEKLDCSKIEEVIDDLGGAQGLTTMNDKYKLATTAEAFTKRCQEMTDAVKTLRKYNKDCFSSLTQQVFSAILRTRAQMNELRCKPDSAEFKESYEASKCIQENAFDAAKEAEKKIILTPQVLLDSNIADDKLRMRRACCSVLDSKALFLAATKEKCSKYEKAYADYVDSYSSEAMSLICPDAEKLECGKLESLKIEGVELKNKFFLNPLLKLVKTLDH